jgi:hypothetical protein
MCLYTIYLRRYRCMDIYVRCNTLAACLSVRGKRGKSGGGGGSLLPYCGCSPRVVVRKLTFFLFFLPSFCLNSVKLRGVEEVVHFGTFVTTGHRNEVNWGKENREKILSLTSKNSAIPANLCPEFSDFNGVFRLLFLLPMFSFLRQIFSL